MVRRMFIYTFLCLSILCYSDGYKIIRGTSIAFLPLLDFHEAVGYTGFESDDYQTSIMAIELSLPREEFENPIVHLDEQFNEVALESKGIILESKRINPFGDEQSLLIIGRQSAKNIVYYKLIYFLIEKEKLAQIVVSCPKTQYPNIQMQIMEMLGSVRLEKQNRYETFYEIEMPVKWRIARQLGPIDIYTINGVMPEADVSSIAIYLFEDNVEESAFHEYVTRKNLNRNYFAELNVDEEIQLFIDSFSAIISFVDGFDLRRDREVVKQYCYICLPKSVLLIENDRCKELNREQFIEICKTWKIKRPEMSE